MAVGVSMNNGLPARLIAAVEHKPEQELVIILLLLTVVTNVKGMTQKIRAATTTPVQVTVSLLNTMYSSMLQLTTIIE